MLCKLVGPAARLLAARRAVGSIEHILVELWPAYPTACGRRLGRARALRMIGLIDSALMREVAERRDEGTLSPPVRVHGGTEGLERLVAPIVVEATGWAPPLEEAGA